MYLRFVVVKLVVVAVPFVLATALAIVDVVVIIDVVDGVLNNVDS